MKNGILTWHKSINHGAVLQAYATQNYLKKRGIENVLISYERQVAKVSTVKRVKNLIISIVNGRIFQRRQWNEFEKQKRDIFRAFVSKKLCVCDMTSEFDNVIVGSDMVFDLKQGFNPYMFSYGINAENLFSYAACSGGNTHEIAKKQGVENQIHDGLERFSAFGCRDQETMDFLVSMGSEKEMVPNIDPVLLYGFEEERKKWDSGKWKQHSYILIYSYYENMNDKSEIKQIRKFAKDQGCEIVSCGYYHSWVDQNINASPEEFVEMISNAKFIITDTFHGTVFSLIFHKNFISIIQKNAFKLEYLLKQCGMSERIISNLTQIEHLFAQPVEYETFDEWLQEERTKSGEFLINHIR